MTSTKLIASLLFAWLAVVDGWLGIFFTDNSNEARIADVIPDSPADKAGLKPGDLITAIDDQTVADRDTLVTAIRAAKTGQKVRLKVDRAGKEMTFVVKLGERPAEDQIPSPKEQPAKKGAGGAPAAEAMPAAPPYLGVQLEEEDGAVHIARVVPGSPAATAGLAEGDRIVKWGDAAITSTAQIEQQMAKAKAGDEVVLQLRNEQSTRSVRVKLGARDGEGLRARSAPPVAVAEPAEEPKKPPKAKKDKDATKPKKAAGDAMGKPFGTDFAAALRAAEKSGKRVFVVYGASSDGGSQAQRRALHDEQLAEPLGDFVCVYVDAGDNGDLLHERDVRELPTLEILRGGKTLSRHQGYLPVAGLVDFLRGEHPEAEDMPAVTEERPATPHRSDEAALQKELQRLRAEVAELRKLVEELRKQTSGRE